MDRATFDNVYVNANCIAELGFVRAMLAAQDAVDTPAVATAGASPSSHEPAAPVVEDESAVQGVLGFGALTPEQLAQQVAVIEALQRGDLAAVDRLAGQTFGDAIGVGALDAEWGAPDVGLYLDQAHAAQGDIEPRIAAAFARADRAGLAAALAALPAAGPSLAGVLDADGLEAWLACYDAGDAPLHALVAQVRALDPV